MQRLRPILGGIPSFSGLLKKRQRSQRRRDRAGGSTGWCGGSSGWWEVQVRGPQSRLLERASVNSWSAIYNLQGPFTYISFQSSGLELGSLLWPFCRQKTGFTNNYLSGKMANFKCLKMYFVFTYKRPRGLEESQQQPFKQQLQEGLVGWGRLGRTKTGI